MPDRNLNSPNRTIVIVLITVVTAVLSSVGYTAVDRWTARTSNVEYVSRKGCKYLGRILGTDHVVVMDCAGDIKLTEYK